MQQELQDQRNQELARKARAERAEQKKGSLASAVNPKTGNPALGGAPMLTPKHTVKADTASNPLLSSLLNKVGKDGKAPIDGSPGSARGIEQSQVSPGSGGYSAGGMPYSSPMQSPTGAMQSPVGMQSPTGPLQSPTGPIQTASGPQGPTGSMDECIEDILSGPGQPEPPYLRHPPTTGYQHQHAQQHQGYPQQGGAGFYPGNQHGYSSHQQHPYGGPGGANQNMYPMQQSGPGPSRQPPMMGYDQPHHTSPSSKPITDPRLLKRQFSGGGPQSSMYAGYDQGGHGRHPQQHGMVPMDGSGDPNLYSPQQHYYEQTSPTEGYGSRDYQQHMPSGCGGFNQMPPHHSMHNPPLSHSQPLSHHNQPPSGHNQPLSHHSGYQHSPRLSGQNLPMSLSGGPTPGSLKESSPTPASHQGGAKPRPTEGLQADLPGPSGPPGGPPYPTSSGDQTMRGLGGEHQKQSQSTTDVGSLSPGSIQAKMVALSNSAADLLLPDVTAIAPYQPGKKSVAELEQELEELRKLSEKTQRDIEAFQLKVEYLISNY